MAVYTTLSESQVNKLLMRFSLPPLHHMEGAGDGIENTTYFLTLTDQRLLVLTLFEMLDAEHLPPYVQLMHHYHQRGLPVPCPLLDINGIALQQLAKKPALVFPRAPGKHILTPTVQQCAAIGKTLAQLHLASLEFFVDIPNPCGLPWAEKSASFVMPKLDRRDRALLRELLVLGRSLQSLSLPRGIIHGDLFRDNVLFDGDDISAVIDFYNAGSDFLLLDLAITINDWCFDEGIQLNEPCRSALMDAYQTLRPFSLNEKLAWPDCLRWAACRFWLSRLNATLEGPAHPKNRLKSPTQYRNLLLFYEKTPLNR